MTADEVRRVRAKRLHAELIRESAAFWEAHKKPVDADRAYGIAERLEAEARDLEGAR